MWNYVAKKDLWVERLQENEMQRCSFLSTAGNDSCFLTDISKIVALFQTKVKASFNQKVLN